MSSMTDIRKLADSLRKWWLRRAVPISQGNIAALLQQEGIPSDRKSVV